TNMTFDPEQLDKLDYLIAALKKHGVYVNLNLHVIRELDERDGFPPNVNRPLHDKGLDHFYRPLIDANKKYAKDLLEHVNPYTGIAYKDEPAVAMIEINNENGLVCLWAGSWNGIDQIRDPFLADFRRHWNDWLVKKYKDDAALRKAWGCMSEPLGDEMLKNGGFADGYIPRGPDWSLQTNAQTDVPMSNADGVLKIDVKKKSDVGWLPQLLGFGFAVKKDQLYTLEFKAKASQETPISIGVDMSGSPWQNLGFITKETFSTDWQTFRRTFTANQDNEDARIYFNGFKEGGVYEIDFVSLKPGGTISMPMENHIADAPEKESSLGTVPVIWQKKAGHYPKAAVDDFCDFLYDVEAKYWDEMYRFLKDEIKVKQPVSGTQLVFGSTHAQAKMDYCDIHAYWNHPAFPRRAWDGNDWYIRNRALVNNLNQSILPHLAPKRVWGKPYTVSEYNHPFPNQYAAEGLPLIAAFGAFQDWDGIFSFDYASSKGTEPQMMSGFFNIAGSTVQMAHSIACKVLFDTEIEVPTLVARMTAAEAEAKERDALKKTKYPSNISFSTFGLDPALALTHRVAVDVNAKAQEISSVKPLDIKPDRWDLTWIANNAWIFFYNYKEANDGGTWLSTPQVCLYTGFLVGTRQVNFNHIRPDTVSFRFDEKPNLGWTTATLTRLDDEKNGPERYLFVITGETRNTDMVIEKLDGDKITFGNRWGKAPVLCEGVAAKLFWQNVKPERIRCWVLDESGHRQQEIPIGKDGGNAVIETKPEYKTIWYEIEVAP
ncbi:MAG: carbohydrate binding domain-containing protein, partial [Planctomycetaceae bacterium]|nr:carbohydrate binding domain-containing protein [Planctomycetaceae bacterium]